MKKGCNKKIEIKVYTIDGQSFFKKAEVKCGWWKLNGVKYLCNKCKNLTT